MAEQYDRDVEAALDLVAEEKHATAATSMQQAFGASIREHERARVAARVELWLRAEGLGALLGEPLGSDLLAVIRRG